MSDHGEYGTEALRCPYCGCAPCVCYDDDEIDAEEEDARDCTCCEGSGMEHGHRCEACCGTGIAPGWIWAADGGPSGP